MSWKFVMSGAQPGEEINKFALRVLVTDYKFFLFNGRVYFVTKNTASSFMTCDTGIIQSDLF